MKIHWSLPVVAFLLFGQSLAASAQQSVADINNIDNLEGFVDGYFSSRLNSREHNAATVSIVKDGKLIFSKGYGHSDMNNKVPVSPSEHLFRIGSTSKTFTYTAIMQLYEQGKLDLDADVNSYLKDFQIPTTFDGPVTVRSILGHTAGFEDGGLGHLFVSGEENIVPLREAVEKYMPARVNPVGARSAYSNYAISLLGVIVEDITGVSFNEYIEANIYEPLGMYSSSFRQPLPNPLTAKFVGSYFRSGNQWKAQDFTLITNDSPAGGMSSTAHDMAKFMLMHLGEGELNGQRVLKAETARLMRSWLSGPDKDLPGMAYGFYQQEINGYRLFGHAGGTLYFGTDMLMDPANNLGIFLSGTGTGAGEAVGGFIRKFYDHYLPGSNRDPASAASAPSDFAERADTYTGEYFAWRANFSQIEKAMQLMGGMTVALSDSNTLLIGDSEYVEIGEHLFQEVDGESLIKFTAGPGGQITDMNEIADPTGTNTKAPFYYFKGFTFPALGISFAFFLTVVLAAAWRWKKYQGEPAGSRKARYVSFATSISNILFLALMLLLVFSKGFALFHTLPWYFNLLMLLPILASLFAVWQLVTALQSWSNGYWALSTRVYYSLATLSGLFMIWFYYFWNILGFQYF